MTKENQYLNEDEVVEEMIGGSPATKQNGLVIPAALEYSRYPLWLNPSNHSAVSNVHNSPVLVYSPEQEAEFLAKGYTLPGTADPHAYLVSKATEKMDDAIRTMNADVERRVKAGLTEVYNKLYKTLTDELRMRVQHRDWYDSIELAGTETPAIQSALDGLTTDIMDLVRQSSRGTN